jgi:hypothetical protein
MSKGNIVAFQITTVMREDGKKPLRKHADNKVWESLLFVRSTFNNYSSGHDISNMTYH